MHHDGLQGRHIGHKASTSLVRSEGGARLSPLQGVKSQVVQRRSVDCAWLLSSCDWSLQVNVASPAAVWLRMGPDKLSKCGHEIEEQWPWPGRSLDMVEPTPIHGLLL